MATANDRRIIGLELAENVSVYKTALDAISTVVAAWELKDVDGSLPTAIAVKEQLAAYDALSKPTMGINDALIAIRAAV
jgi:hypothetical protein